MSMIKDKETKVKKHEEKTGVFCNNLDQLVCLALQERGEDPRDITGLVGLDQGQGSLKVALTLVNKNKDDEESVRSKYFEGVAPKTLKIQVSRNFFSCPFTQTYQRFAAIYIRFLRTWA